MECDNMLARKLQRFSELAREDIDYLDDVIGPPAVLTPRRDIIREGEAPEDVFVLISGLACRYKLLRNGRRQLVALLVPGDLCNLHMMVLDRMDHSVGALSQCLAVRIPKRIIQEMLQRPAIGRALWWAALTDEAILREWLLSVGQRSASERLAHLFYEMYLRLQAVGLTDDNSYRLPVTQIELGDAMGLSSVHINRTLQKLRGQGLLAFDGGKVVILDPKSLMTYAGFRDDYLFLRGGHGRSSGAVRKRSRVPPG